MSSHCDPDECEAAEKMLDERGHIIASLEAKLAKLTKAAEAVVGYEGNCYANAYETAWPTNRAEVYMNLELAVKEANSDPLDAPTEGAKHGR